MNDAASGVKVRYCQVVDEQGEMLVKRHERQDILNALLNVARTAQDMDQPGYNLHPLKGKQSGTWSVSVTGNWRVTFKINDGEVTDVDLVDYH